MTIAGAIKIMFNTLLSREKLYCVVGTVKSVDDTARTCVVEPIDGSPDLYDVRLQSSMSLVDKGMCVFPVVNSFVTVAFYNKNTGVVVSASEIKQIYVDCDLFRFNRGTNFGLIQIVNLTEKLNKLVSEVNGLIGKYNAHTHPLDIAHVVTLTTAATATTATSFLKTDYEDTKVTH